MTEGTSMRGYSMERDDYLKRLRRVEGQVRGIQRMVEEDVYCIDILTQISAVNKAMQSVAVGLLNEHLHHCVANAMKDGEGVDQKIAEATAAIERLVKS
jgi:DNA-binding FrmR family transcriptional regulator